MNCPLCQNSDSRVVGGRLPVRRRECTKCRHRWSTVEVPAEDAKATARARELAKELLETLKEGTV